MRTPVVKDPRFRELLELCLARVTFELDSDYDTLAKRRMVARKAGPNITRAHAAIDCFAMAVQELEPITHSSFLAELPLDLRLLNNLEDCGMVFISHVASRSPKELKQRCTAISAADIGKLMQVLGMFGFSMKADE